jgi:Domain of unknown function (DUF1874).
MKDLIRTFILGIIMDELTRAAKIDKRVVLLNALPIQAFKYTHFTITCKRVSLDAVKDIVLSADVVESYIRHEATIRALNEAFNLSLTPNPGIYEYRDNDTLLIVTLKTPRRGVEVQQLTIDDLDFTLCVCSKHD